MTTNNSFLFILKGFGEVLGEIFYFPLWWYGRGLYNAGIFLFNFLSGKQKKLALFIWVKNLFKPMYGQTDWQGKVISFLMRLVQIVYRSFVLFLWAIISLLAFLIWIALPPFVFYQIIYQLFPNIYIF